MYACRKNFGMFCHYCFIIFKSVAYTQKKIRRPFNVSSICLSGFCYWDKYSVTSAGDDFRNACGSSGEVSLIVDGLRS